MSLAKEWPTLRGVFQKTATDRRVAMSSFEADFLAGPLSGHRHERRGGGRLSTRMIRLESPAHVSADAPTEELVVGLILSGRAAAQWSWDGAAPNVSPSRRPGTLGLTPPGSSGSFEVDGPSEMLIIALPYRELTTRLEPDAAVPRDFGSLHDAYQDRPHARGLAFRLWRAAQVASPGRDLLIDFLAERLILALAGRPEGAEAPTAGLGPRETDRVLARAAAGAADVAGLALACGMPVRTFRRRFRASFGCAPHVWLSRRRLKLAMQCLEGTTPLSEIALDLGFASQSHFSEAFRRSTGVAPGRFRRDRSRSRQ